MPKKPISQKNWRRGLVANVPDQVQPPDSLSRVSNMLYTRRGGLRTCDGSLIVSALSGAVAPGTGPWTDIYLFQPANVNKYYVGIKKDPTRQLAAPTVATVTDGGAGGTLPAGTYHYVITTLDGAGGETTSTGDLSIANVGNHIDNVNWNRVSNAISYNIYRGDVNLTNYGLLTNVADTGAASYTFGDNNSLAVDHATLVPGVNTTQQCPLFKIPATSYTSANILATFPADAIVVQDNTPGGAGGGGGTTNPTGGAPPNAAGGNSGNISPEPQIVQFANKLILALGNGFAPQLVADSVQPNWVTLTTTNAGDVILPLTNNAGAFYFIATTGGVTGGANPVFPQTVGSTVADGTVTWQNISKPPVVALLNTFTSIYPDWNANVTYAVGDLIRPTTNNAGGFVFQCLQGGISANAAPVFPQTRNSVVAEATHNVLWKNIGIGTSTPAPRGAWHAEVYAGALWLLNTSPTTTTDQLDGPSCLKMSEINNPLAWNPLNTAFLDRDDSDFGTGLKAMTIAESGIPPTGSLVAFKNFKTFQVNGVFGSTNFSIQRAKTDMGCIAPRSIEFCPGYGIIRLAHLGFSLFDMVNDRVISENIRPFLFKDPNITDIITMDWNLAYFSKAAQTADPPMYVCATPLALDNLPLSASGGVTITTQAGVSTWPQPAPYFFRTTKFTTLSDGTVFESAITTESEFIIGDLNTQIKVQSFGGVLDTAAVKFRIYEGTATGVYNNYVEVTPTAMAAGVTLTGLASLPNTGSILNGIGGLTRLFCFDLVLKAWAVIDLPFAVSVLKQVRPPGSEPITIVGGFSDGTMRRIQAGDTTWDGTAITWSFRPSELMGLGGSERVFYHRLAIKGVGASPSVTVTPAYDYTADAAITPELYTNGSNRFTMWAPLMTNAMTAHATVSGTGVVEIDALDWSLEPLPVPAPPQFA